MKALRNAFGIAALVLLALALNMLAFRLDLFGWQTLAPLAAALACGLIWLVLTFILKAGAHEGGNALHGLSAVVGSIVFLGICIAVYAFVARWDASWDLTQEGRRELSELTVQLLEGLDQEVKVYCLFADIGTKEVMVARDKTRRFLERCQKHTDYLNVTFMDPQKEVVKLQAMGVSFASPEGTVLVESGGKKQGILLKGVSRRLEERDFTNTLYKVIRESSPKLYFLQGHNERTNTAVLKKVLSNDSYESEDVAILVADPKVPEDCDLLIINRLESNLHPAEMQAIDEYLERGGRLLVLLDPVFQKGMTVVPWLRERYGIEVGEDLVVSQIDKTFGMLSLLPDTAAARELARYGVEDVEFSGCFSQSHTITRNFNQAMNLSGARSVTLADERPDNVAGAVILRTLPLAWAEQGLDDLQNAEPDEDEMTGSIGVAVAVTVKTDVPIGDSGMTKDARIVVIGDSDITTDESFATAGHVTFLPSTVAWLTEREELIAIRPALTDNPPIYLTESQQRAMGWIATMGTLQVPLILGLAVYLTRRKYQ